MRHSNNFDPKCIALAGNGRFIAASADSPVSFCTTIHLQANWVCHRAHSSIWYLSEDRNSRCFGAENRQLQPSSRLCRPTEHYGVSTPALQGLLTIYSQRAPTSRKVASARSRPSLRMLSYTERDRSCDWKAGQTSASQLPTTKLDPRGTRVTQCSLRASPLTRPHPTPHTLYLSPALARCIV